jgi:uncharacterized protein (TIGR02597 family)
MTRHLSKLLGCLLGVANLVQAEVTSPIVGFMKLHLQEETNFIGFALLPVMELQAAFNISGSDRKVIFLQGSGLTLTDGQFSPGPLATHAVEIVSAGSGQGVTRVISQTLAAGNQLTLTDEVPAGVADGASLKIWRLWTLADVFGESNSAGLTSAETPEQSDLILIPNGSGFDKYFYCSGGAQGAGWRKQGGGVTDMAEVPLPLAGGMAIRARSAKTILLVGQVKPGATQVSLQTGHNYVANLCPVNASGTGASSQGRKLGNSGLEQGLTGGTASSLADLVLLWNGKGYDQYYFSTGGLAGNGWRKVGDVATSQADVALPDGAFIIFRRGAPTTLVLNQGSF